MTTGLVLRRLGLGALGLLLAAAAVTLATGVASAADACWGCEKYECKNGFPSGAYLCEMVQVECSLVDKIFFGCNGRYCRTDDPCPLTITQQPLPTSAPARAGRTGPGSTTVGAAPIADNAPAR